MDPEHQTDHIPQYSIDGTPLELHVTILNYSGPRMNGSAIVGSHSIQPTKTFNVVQQPWLMVIICSLYCIIFVCGIFGNGLVSFVVICNRSMHTVTNCFIASLAINDIVICAVAVPLTPLYTFLEGWYFGLFMCHLFSLIQSASIFISTLTLTAIALERFCVIVYPNLPRRTPKAALFIILLIWILSFSICSPYAAFMRYHPEEHPEELPTVKPRCDEEWPADYGMIFGTVSLVVQCCIPLVIITVCYVSVWMKLRLQRSTSSMTNRQRGQINRMLVAMVVIFGCCWLPLNLINLLSDLFRDTITRWEYFVLVFLVSHIVAVSSTCYNPILYAWMNDNFRKEFKAVLPCLPSARKHVSAVTNNNSTIVYNETQVDGSLQRPFDPDFTFMITETPEPLRKILQSNGAAVGEEQFELLRGEVPTDRIYVGPEVRT